jgi:hypothetical protein
MDVGLLIIVPKVIILDSKNVDRTCRLCINSPSMTAELSIIYSGIDNPFLCNDEVFIKNVMEALRSCGYEGANFSEPSAGGNKENIVVLDGCDDFAAWAAKKYGWVQIKLKS